MRIIENEQIEPANHEQPISGQATNKAMSTVPKYDFEGLRYEVRSLAAELKEMKKTMSTNNKSSEGVLPPRPEYTDRITLSAGNVYSMANIARNCKVRNRHMRKN